MSIKSIIFVITIVLSPLTAAKPLTLNGVGMYTDIVDNFLGALYLEQSNRQQDTINNYQSDFKLEHKIVNNRYSVSLWRNYLRKNLLLNTPSAQLEQHQTVLKHLMSVFNGRLHKGDVISVTAIGNTTEVHINHHPVLSYDNRELATMLLQGWIGEHPISQGFKHTILGLDNNQHNAIKRYQQLAISPGREQLGKEFAILAANNEDKIAQTTQKTKALKASTKVPATKVNPEPIKPESTTALAVTNTPKPSNKSGNNPVKATAKPIDFAATETSFSQRLNAEQKYQEQLLKAIYKNVRYPSRAVTKEIEGVVHVFFSVQDNGEITEINAESDTNSNLLKRAAVSAVKKAQKSQDLNPPETFENKEVSVAIRFQLTDDKPSNAFVAR